ncbi:MAG: Fur family transcriptional regulator ferric uptake regulator [Nitrospirae bacterium]|nr:MAG: Fur family transcriptional regulator ferric uptake regulator [Nitrospirota bacterium]
MDNRFRDFIAGKGLKATKERAEILQEIIGTVGHFDPDELYFRLRAKGSKVSRASIYRTIPLLIEGRFIDEVERVGKHAHYECVVGGQHHDHMICIKCGAVLEFYSPTLEDLQDDLCRQHRFSKVRHHLEILGVCSACDAGETQE